MGFFDRLRAILPPREPEPKPTTLEERVRELV